MLSRLRHRGYDSWGVATMNSRNPIISSMHSSMPLLVDANEDDESPKTTAKKTTTISIGHTRYTTKGSHNSTDQMQPLLNVDETIALVHNGQVEFDETHYASDSQYILRLIQDMDFQSSADDVSNQFKGLFQTLSGSYSCLAIISGIGLIAFRDPRGIRPLSFHYTRETGSIRFASESCAWDEADEDTTMNVLPGQVCWVKPDGKMQFLLPLGDPPNFNPELCLFELIYLAHDDSAMDGISIRDARRQMGRNLVNAVKQYPHSIDYIVPVPHTPVIAGRELARECNMELVELLDVVSTTGRRESRTFILPTTSARESAVKKKFSITDDEAIEKCRGKNLLIVDDSIVRGTTLKRVISLIRKIVGPQKIFVASLSPPITSPNVFGIDIPDTRQLIAAPFSDNQDDIAKEVGHALRADGPVIYQTLSGLTHGLPNLPFEKSVFMLNHAEMLGRQW